MQEVKIPNKILHAIEKSWRNLVLYGGRGSGKSQSIARILLAEAYQTPIKSLCSREVQNSIADSVHSLLEEVINESSYYQKFFKITDKEITGANGSQFIFKGLKKETAGSVKSMEGVNICWVEEAQFISRYSLDILVPTIREENSKIIFTMNPTNDDDPVYVDYVLSNRPDTVKCQVNWQDNPLFPDVLRSQMEWDRAHDIDKYNHIWEGMTTKHSDAQIFNGKWVIEDFETPFDAIFYHGSDFGFSSDPTTLVRCFILGNRLYIDQESGGVGIELDAIETEYDKIPTARKWPIYADSSRPETISYLRRKNFNIKSCDKWHGSVEDGIEYLRHFEEIVIHPRCKNTAYEFRSYCYKTDKLTGKVTPLIIDANNHYIDAIRYACNDLIKNKTHVIKLSRYSAGSLGL